MRQIVRTVYCDLTVMKKKWKGSANFLVKCQDLIFKKRDILFLEWLVMNGKETPLPDYIGEMDIFSTMFDCS